jgi:hypothetical protein
MYLVTSGPDIPAVSFRCLSPVTPDAKGPGQYERCTTRRFHRGLSSIVRSKQGEAGLLPAKKAGSYLRFSVGRHYQLATTYAGA